MSAMSSSRKSNVLLRDVASYCAECNNYHSAIPHISTWQINEPKDHIFFVEIVSHTSANFSFLGPHPSVKQTIVDTIDWIHRTGPVSLTSALKFLPIWGTDPEGAAKHLDERAGKSVKPNAAEVKGVFRDEATTQPLLLRLRLRMIYHQAAYPLGKQVFVTAMMVVEEQKYSQAEKLDFPINMAYGLIDKRIIACVPTLEIANMCIKRQVEVAMVKNDEPNLERLLQEEKEMEEEEKKRKAKGEKKARKKKAKRATKAEQPRSIQMELDKEDSVLVVSGQLNGLLWLGTVIPRKSQYEVL